MAHEIGALSALEENLSWILSTHNVQLSFACNFSPRGCSTLFCPLWAHAFKCTNPHTGTHACSQIQNQKGYSSLHKKVVRPLCFRSEVYNILSYTVSSRIFEVQSFGNMCLPTCLRISGPDIKESSPLTMSRHWLQKVNGKY